MVEGSCLFVVHARLPQGLQARLALSKQKFVCGGKLVSKVGTLTQQRIRFCRPPKFLGHRPRVPIGVLAHLAPDQGDDRRQVFDR